MQIFQAVGHTFGEAMPHTILLIQPTSRADSRTWTDYEEESDCLEVSWSTKQIKNNFFNKKTRRNDTKREAHLFRKCDSMISDCQERTQFLCDVLIFRESARFSRNSWKSRTRTRRQSRTTWPHCSSLSINSPIWVASCSTRFMLFLFKIFLQTTRHTKVLYSVGKNIEFLYKTI